ncbi:modifier of rudimentary (Mod(r)) protein [Ancylostoma ceylanicum]|uniref:Modifier of rudimentary (Mod(R)) protein n=1 Tax=Ancylostoma ceylanicum TaxID=53326 RepID=A0A0D6M8Y5_9BILA|nr:modifier of rudimentary (Mod(r)) protein [Ancylostoma ceylanicum]
MYNSQSTYDSLVDVCVNSAMASIRSMTTDQLNELLYNESRLDNLIDNLPQIRSLPTEREAGIAQNKSLAEWNLAQEPKLNQLRMQLGSTRLWYFHLSLLPYSPSSMSIVQNYGSECDCHFFCNEISSSKSLDTTSNLLQVAAQEADDDAENTARAFLEGTISTEQFMKDLLEKKTLAHLRKIKSDRLISVLRDQQYAQAAPAVPPRAGTAPYPEMPMPNRHSYY